MKTKEAQPETIAITIRPPNMQRIQIKIRGAAPYVQHKFSEKARKEMLSKHIDPTAKSKKKKEARNVDREFEAAIHYSTDGWVGIPAPALRSAMIRACTLVGYHMTRAKISVFVEPDGFDADDGTPLVRLIANAPEKTEMSGRLGDAAGTACVIIRPMWREWAADVVIKYDGDQFSAADVTNLLARAGLQVGIGEGRPDSKRSNGMGWGLFEIVSE